MYTSQLAISKPFAKLISTNMFYTSQLAISKPFAKLIYTNMYS